MSDTLTAQRFERLRGELDSYAPTQFFSTIPASDCQVLGNPFATLPLLRMCQPYHVEGQTFQVTPGWCEFTEVTYGGLPLRVMEPVTWAPGTLLFLECVNRWNVSSGRSNGEDVFFKDGGYAIRRAEIVAYQEAPLAFEGPPDVGVSESEVNEDTTRRFPIGTVGVATVTPIFTSGIFPGVLNAFDFVLIA